MHVCVDKTVCLYMQHHTLAKWATCIQCGEVDM